MQPTATAPATTSQQALSQLQAQQAGNKSAGDYLTGANTALGVNDAQNTVTGLRTSIDNTTKLLNAVAPSVMGRTGGSLVTNAQATKQISNEQAPISKNLTTLGGQYTNAQSDYSNLQSQAEKQASLDYQSQQDQTSYLQNLYNTLYGKEQDTIKQQQAAEQQAEQIRQYNADLAEKQREADLSASTARATASSSNSGLDLSGLASLFGSGGGNTMTKDKSGGTQFKDANGKSITAYTYFGGNSSQLQSFLNSDKNSAAAAKDFASGKFTRAQLSQKYPYIFGGA